MKELTRVECADWLLARDRFTILTHRKPDGDTIGSSAALCLGLRSLGKTAHVLQNDEVTALYAPLLEGLTKAQPEEGDVLIAVDVAADSMLPKAYADMKNCIDLRIDHHGSGREYTPNEYVDPDSAACAEIIWELLLDMGVEPDEKMAEAVYVAFPPTPAASVLPTPTPTPLMCALTAQPSVRTFSSGTESCLIPTLWRNCGCRLGWLTTLSSFATARSPSALFLRQLRKRSA